MICNYFLYTKKFDSPFDAMNEFNRQRCKDSKVYLALLTIKKLNK